MLRQVWAGLTGENLLNLWLMAFIAAGLIADGIGRGTRAAVMVPPGLDFFSLVFGVFKAGVVPVLIDPGMGVKSLGKCLDEAEPKLFEARYGLAVLEQDDARADAAFEQAMAAVECAPTDAARGAARALAAAVRKYAGPVRSGDAGR